MIYIYQLAQLRPNFVKNGLVKMASEELGPDYDVATHFTPRYNPWDQRLCLVPDGDMFARHQGGARQRGDRSHRDVSPKKASV